MSDKIRIGCGAGFSGDRLEPALVLAEKGNLDFLVLECLAERTIALAQKRKLQDPALGYDPFLERRLDVLLPALATNKIRLITNMGAANPVSAARKAVEIARSKNLKLKVAAVTGDDVLDCLAPKSLVLETGRPLSEVANVISANAYLGLDGILTAIRAGADIIITGRVADPSLFVAPMVSAFGWSVDDSSMIGKGTVVGHLLECAGQLTGGYFADPGKKDVDGMDILGHPFADVFKDGSANIGKVDGTGGVISLQTVKEQLLYEVVNPYEYFTPDVVADFSTVRLEQIDRDVVRVTGGGGKQKPSTLKVSVGYQAFYLGEGEISYAGANAVARARLAGNVVESRLKSVINELRVDIIGHSAIHGDSLSDGQPYEVRLRVSGRASSPSLAAKIGEEVEALYTNGPAGGGGARKNVTEVIGILSTLIERQKAEAKLTYFDS